jgi:hypothetical protein
MKRILIMLLFLCTIAIQAVYADVPRTINYQGRLTDTAGNPVADGLYSVAIRMYDAVDALEGASVWSDTYSVQTKNGYLNVVLGSNPSFPINNSFSKPYWIGLKVGTDTEMTPRQALQAVPYSLGSLGPQLIGYRVLTAGPGTYVPTEGTNAIMVEVQGGGGGGGGGASSIAGYGAAGSGGGAGGYAKKYIASPEESYDYTVAATASGASPGVNSGAPGNTSTFGNPAIITCNGGTSGSGSGSQNGSNIMSSSAAGGTATGGDINLTGGPSEFGFLLECSKALPSSGGKSVLGEPGTPITTSNSGNDGTGYGSGGGGASSYDGGSAAGGGDGAAGVIIIWEFK